MSGVIRKEEYMTFKELCDAQVMWKFRPGELQKLTQNGGIALICGDGDIDVGPYHRQGIERPHSLRTFGGPMLLAPTFRGYSQKLAEGLLENISWGMKAKDTGTVFFYLHYPCGVASMFKMEMEQVIELAVDINNVLWHNQFFTPKEVFGFFHIRRLAASGKEKQNTYRLIF